TKQLRLRDPCREGEAPAIAEDIGDNRERAVFDVLEPQHGRLPACFEFHRQGGHFIVERHRLLDAQDAFGLCLGEGIEKIAQVARRPVGIVRFRHATACSLVGALHASTIWSRTQLSKAWHKVSMWVNLPESPTGRHRPSCWRSTASLSSG